MPVARRDRGEVGKRLDLLRARRAHLTVLDARVQLVPLDPDHRARHVRLLAAQVGEVGDELRDVVALRRRELPVLLQPEGEPVEARVTLLVHVVLDGLGVVSTGPVGVVYLCHLEGVPIFVCNVCDGLDRSLILVCERVPPVRDAPVAEDLRRLGGGGAQGAERKREGTSQHYDSVNEVMLRISRVSLVCVGMSI